MSGKDDSEPFDATVALGDASPSFPTSVVRVSVAPLAPGEIFAGRYRVEALIGQGGMGAVYRVRDLQLDEVVALKVMTLPSNEAAERFVEEVRLARRVTHPNVARTHDLGEHQGQRYLTMELVEGESLDALLDREGRVEPSRVLELGIQMARGLAAAHEAGVIHRDLKPANVLLAGEGRAVITDFGIARAEVKSSGRQTIGMIGTPAYMSPEQAMGEKIDPRSDLYSLGVVLYELVTARLPFEEVEPIAAAVARVSRAPTHPSKHGPVPAALADLLMQLLATRPEARPASAAHVLQLLEAFRGGRTSSPNAASTATSQAISAPGSRQSLFAPLARGDALAVLPFRYRGPAEHDYLGEGVAEALVDTLSRTRGLKVIALGAAARFVEDRDPIRIRTELDAAWVVDGTIQLSGDRVRLSARLLDTEGGVQRWSDRFDAGLADVLDLQESLARRVAEALRLEVGASVGEGHLSPEALELYMRARQQLRRGMATDTVAPITQLEQCLALAPSFAAAVAAHAIASVRLTWRQEADATGSLDRARASVQRAEAQASHVAETHLARAMMETQMGAYRAAAAALRRALEIAPTLAEAHYYLGYLQVESGRLKEGLKRLALSLEVDPNLAPSRMSLLRVHMLLGEEELAAREHAKLAEQTGEHSVALLTALLRFALYRRDHEERVRLSTLFREVAGGAFQLMFRLEGVEDGSVDDAQAAALVSAIGAHYVNPRFAAVLTQFAVETFLYAGRNDLALDTLLKLAEGIVIDVLWLEHCPLFEPVRADPRFVDAATKIKNRAAAIWTS